jgi:hypothetical protein
MSCCSESRGSGFGIRDWGRMPRAESAPRERQGEVRGIALHRDALPESRIPNPESRGAIQ